MKILESFDVAEKFPNPVLTIGNYDGVHIGHKRIIKKVVTKASEISGTPMLMTFSPHPHSVLKPDSYIRLITPQPVKERLVAENGIEVMFQVPFDERLRSISPESFIEDILVGKLGVAGVIVGYDFRFGKGGTGDVEMLRQFAQKRGFYFDVVGAITVDAEKIGSNRIRRLIMEGDVKKANELLDRPHMIEGIVVHGVNRGKSMGFPTINFETVFELIPHNGVYITEVEFDGKRWPSVTNIGYNPTFDGKKLLVETHILDYVGDLYDRDVVIYFQDRIREEKKFRDMAELKEQIAADVGTARRYFTERPLE
ncbi:MAG: bifunctional riboflavin kinase/FAD synthetase [Syntrophorhabdaceae bacterium]|nr:bifunctional riboflavin kinase/FAD synthetase [Syntrophorhabdaceae bacterium]